MPNLFELTFLSSKDSLSKKYELVGGKLEKSSYPNAYFFTSTAEPVASIADFERHIKHHAAKGNCILKGTLETPLLSQSRAGATSSYTPTYWICLDIDGLPATKPIDQLLKELNLGDVSYVLQMSASARIQNDDHRCHVFMLMDGEALPDTLKQWLIGANLNNPYLLASTQLSANGVTLKWGLDVTACQNDKLLYIAPPELVNLPDPFKSKPRVSLIKRKLQAIPKDRLIPPKPEANKEQQRIRVDALRSEAKLPSRAPAKYKVMDKGQVITNPDAANITGTWEDRGFVYFDLNGGDSGAYYHPANNAEVIYSFKGEEPCLTRVLLPDYYAEAKDRAKQASKEYAAEKNTGVQAKETVQYIAFKDKTSGKYHAGRYLEQSNVLDLDEQKSEKQVRDFCAQHGVMIGDFVPIWDLCFNPSSETRIDVDKRTINEFTLSPLLKNPFKKTQTCPPTVFKVIHHALGSETETTEHFMNWLATLVQKRQRAETAWLFHGVEGTGKGLLYHKILRPLLGETNTTMNQVAEMSKGFNGFLRNKILVAFDETHIGPRLDAEELMGKLRNLITEPTISIRDLYRSAAPSPNFTSYIFFSNKRDALLLNANDRRYNIGKWQTIKLNARHKEFLDQPKTATKIASEPEAFAAYMRSYPIDTTTAAAVLESPDRELLINTTTTTAETVATHLSTNALMSFFIAELPTNDDKRMDMEKKELSREYKATLIAIMKRTMARLGARNRNKDVENCVITRDEAHTIFQYTVGSMPASPTKFTQLLRHKHLEPTVVWIDKSVNGLKVDWKDALNFPEYLKALGLKEKA